MSVRVVIDVAEDDLEAATKDPNLAMAFVKAVYDIKQNAKLGSGTTISTVNDVKVEGRAIQDGVDLFGYSFEFGYGRYREDQASVMINGENGSTGQCPVRKVPTLK